MRTWIYAALAAGSMFALSPAANAAVVQCEPSVGCSSNDGVSTYIFGHQELPINALFNDAYEFVLPSTPGSLNLTFSSSTEGVEFSSVTLNGQAATIIGGQAVFEFGQTSLSTTGLLANLMVAGSNTGTQSGVYSGNLTFAAAPNVVPLPGALVLMGTVLAGGAGFGAMRKRAKKASGLQAA